MADPIEHQPVLFQETLAHLNLRPGATVIDGTVGHGGHATAILEATGPDGRLLGLDRDQSSLAIAKKQLAQFGSRCLLQLGRFSQMGEIYQQTPFADQPVAAILLDLGLASSQLLDPNRGFSFQHGEAPLDMRLYHEGPTAADLLNTLPRQKLIDILSEYGDEQFAGPIAATIVSVRQKQIFTSVNQLTDAVLRVYRQRKPQALHASRHPATKTFQALRLAVNGDLDELRAVLPVATNLLRSGGRLAVITFQSAEHRIVREWFRRESRDCLETGKVPICTCGHHASLTIVTKRAIHPTPTEEQTNRRSRSAQLRVASKR